MHGLSDFLDGVGLEIRLIVGLWVFNSSACVGHRGHVTVPGYNGVGQVGHQLKFLVAEHTGLESIIVCQPVMHPVEILDRSINRFEIGVMLETT